MAARALERWWYPIHVERIENGYVAYCPSLTKPYGNGITYEAALVDLHAKITTEIRERRNAGLPMPSMVQSSLTYLEGEA